MEGRDNFEKLEKSRMIRIRKTIDQTHLFPDIGQNPKIKTCFFMVQLRGITAKK